jgi:hypothetical protein
MSTTSKSELLTAVLRVKDYVKDLDKQIFELTKACNTLAVWKQEMLSVHQAWNEIEVYVRAHTGAKDLGRTISDIVLSRLKEHEQLIYSYERLGKDFVRQSQQILDLLSEKDALRSELANMKDQCDAANFCSKESIDWFDCLVGDLAHLLKCKKKPSEVVAAVTDLIPKT